VLDQPQVVTERGADALARSRGSDTLVPSQRASQARMAWPMAALVIIGASAALWAGIAYAASLIGLF
jgi:hypothetical protein